jgi:hypothetical protein
LKRCSAGEETHRRRLARSLAHERNEARDEKHLTISRRSLSRECYLAGERFLSKISLSASSAGADRRGTVDKFSYDGLNRRTLAGFGYSGGSYQDSISYPYEARDRLTQAVDSGEDRLLLFQQFGLLRRTY